MRGLTAGVAALALLMLGAPSAQAQPRVGEGGTFAIRGGTVVTGTGQRIENGTVVIEDGRITAVGANVQAPAGATVIDASGRFVYPGMIDAYTPLGLSEIGGISTMNLRSELGEFNPHMRAVVALNVDSELLGVTRANGVTNVLSTPSSGSSMVSVSATSSTASIPLGSSTWRRLKASSCRVSSAARSAERTTTSSEFSAGERSGVGLS